MSVTQAEVIDVLRRIEAGEITLTPDRDPQEHIKGDILFSASNGWKIEVSNWSGEFGGIVEIGLPGGGNLDLEYLETHMPEVGQYFPTGEVAWRAYRMKAVEAGFVYVPVDKTGPLATASPGDLIEIADRKPPWIVAYHSLGHVLLANWPGRLWLVQVVERLEPQGHRGNYTRCISVRIIREIKTHHVFGAHGEAVEEVLAYASALARPQAEQLAANRHDEAKVLQTAGWYRWLAETEKRETSDECSMDGVLAAGQGATRSPIGHGLSLVHGGVWNAAIRADGDAAIEEDEDESWLVSPWSEAASALMDAAWGKGAPEFFDEAEREILLQAWRARVAA
ncbi:hypothetical protein [Maricaulis sp.]|uniref:hypothetical protein n=1 Tax=Maricaulis sp. TaxID=1486257 RepID=UPI003298AA27